MDEEKVTKLVLPDLANCKLGAYVGPGAKKHIIDKEVDLTA